VLRQDLLVREERDGLHAVRADHPVHLEGVVRVEFVSVEIVGFDALRLGLDDELRPLGRGASRALKTLHGFLPLLGWAVKALRPRPQQALPVPSPR
jgi:hypothetical protein